CASSAAGSLFISLIADSGTRPGLSFASAWNERKAEASTRICCASALNRKLLEIRPAEISRSLECRGQNRAAIVRAALDDFALPLGIQQVGETLWCILGPDQIGVVADGAKRGEHGCVHSIGIDLLGREVLCYILRYVGRQQSVALPVYKMPGVGAADDIDFKDA